MDDARANNEPIEEPPAGTDQLAADLAGRAQLKDNEASAVDEANESQR